MLAGFHGIPHCIATSNCTTALHIALKALDIGPGDSVVCPDLTFIAPANMIKLAGAELILCDIDPLTLNLDPVQLLKVITPNTKAIIVVHQFGHAAPMDEIMQIARSRGIKVIEDNAESIGGLYKGRMLGTIGDISCYSFFANKIITTGEGGAILCKDAALDKRCRILRDHGMSREIRYMHLELGYNYRMTNLQAAVGVGQMERLESILKLRARQLETYTEKLSQIPMIMPRKFANWSFPSHWLTTISLAPPLNRDIFIVEMRKRGVDCRPMINPVHWADHFRPHFKDGSFPNAIQASVSSLHLPSSTTLTDQQIDFVVSVAAEIVELQTR
jgi:perosamine synthetase